jgi:spore coat protein U-like protein
MTKGSLRTYTRLAALTLVAAGITGAAEAAGNKTADLAVNASVTNNCTISAGTLTFGVYDPVGVNASADSTTTSQLLIACTKGAAATIALGTGGNANATSRRLASGANFLPYNLYRDNGAVWADGASAVTYNSTTRVAQPFSVVGKIAAGADVPEGTYTDTIVATVNF